MPDAPRMADLIAGFDWGTTPLGPMADWPQSLRTAVDILLGSGHAMQLAWGPARTVIYNDAYAPMLGARHPAALGLPFRDAWPDIWEDIAPLVARVFQGETVRFQDMPLIMTRHGAPEETWWNFSYSPVRDETGAVAGLLNVTVDATPRKRAEQAEQALRQSEQRLRGVLDGMGEAFGLMDGNLRIITQNPAALRLDHRTLDEIRGRSHWEVYPGSEDSELGRLYKRALRDQAPVSLEHLYDWPGGGQSWLEMRAYPVPEGLAVFWRDISARKAAEQALREGEERRAFLLNLSDAVAPLTDPREIQATTTRMLGDHLKASRTMYSELDEETQDFVVHAQHVREGDPFPARVPFQAYLRGMPADMLRPNEPLVVHDVTTDPRIDAEMRAAWIAADVIAIVAVALVKPGRPVATFGFHHARPRHWTAAEIDLVRDVANRNLDAVERARAELALRESEDRQAFLLALSDALRPLAEPLDIIDTASRLLGERLGVDRVAYGDMLPDGEHIAVPRDWGAAGSPVPPLIGTYKIVQFGQFVADAFHAGVLAVIEDAATHTGIPKVDYDQSWGAIGVRAALAFPLVKGGVMRAGFAVYSAPARQWATTEKTMVEDVGERIWDAVERARSEAGLRESEERQAFLLRLSDALRSLSDPAEIQQVAMRLLAEQHGVMRAMYLDVAEDGDTMTPAARFEHDAVPTPDRLLLSHYGPGIADAFRAGQTLFVRDAEAEAPTEAHRAAYRASGVRAWIVAPLVKDGRLIAMVGVQSRTARDWTRAQVQIVTDLAERTFAAVERARAEAALRRSEDNLRRNEIWLAAQKDAFQAAANGEPLERSLAFLTQAIIAGSETERRCAFYIRNAEGTGLSHVIGMDPAYASDVDGFAISADSLACGLAVAEGRPVITRDVRDEPLWAPWLWMAEKHGFRGCWSFPVETSAGQRVGSLAMYFAEPHEPTPRDLALAASFTHAASIVISRQQETDERRRSEERLRQFGEASQDVLWIRDAETLQWQYLTPAFEAIYGLSREEAMGGNNYRSWLDLIVPEDRARARDSIARVRAGEHVTFDYRIRRPHDGTIRWLRNTDFPIRGGDGTVRLVGGIGHDLTELREAETRLQTLIEGIPQLVWRAVDGGEWTWTSPQWTDYTGQAAAESLGRGWLDMLHPDDRARATGAWAHAVGTGGFEVDYRLRRAAGPDYRWFQTRATPVRGEGGAILEWLGTSTDIHDLRALQERQQVLVGELQHRTRNLMGVVRAMADRTAEASDDIADFRARFRDRLEALARVQGLLSRLGETDRVAFDTLIETELRAMKGAAGQVTLDGPKGIRLRSGMVQTLAMALHELATNAVKYGALSQPDARLAVRWWLGEADRHGRLWLHIDWRESGVAMPPARDAPQGTGQGRELIEAALPYQLGATTTFTLAPDGVHCTIAIPVSARNVVEEG